MDLMRARKSAPSFCVSRAAARIGAALERGVTDCGIVTKLREFRDFADGQTIYAQS
jgi:hypothetical protein